MKALQLIKTGSLSGIQLNELKNPVPGDFDVLVKIKSMSLNYRDYALITGAYPLAKPLPLTLGSDAAGVVEKIGRNVTQFKPGDHVISLLRQRWHGGPLNAHKAGAQLGGSVDGVFSEWYSFQEASLVHAPTNMNFHEASTLPTAALTACRVLTQPELLPGQRIVIQGTGSVSLFALQMASRMGFEIFATTGTKENELLLKQMGAHHVINYKKYPAWEKEILAIASDGVDLVIDVAGGDSLQQSIDAAALNGKVAVVGFLNNTLAHINLVTLIRKNISLKAFTTGSREDLENLVQWLNVNSITPVIAGIYQNFYTAFREFEKRGAPGKIVVDWP
jgi:NADPH:quinone reductase-like Zn-dependent oxidoreductase